MDKRFSTLFLDPPRLSTDKSADVNKAPSSKMKKVLGRLFNGPPRRSPNPSTQEEKAKFEHAERLWDTVISFAKPGPKKPAAVVKTVKPLPAPKPQGGRNTNISTQSVTVSPPSELPSYTTKDIFYKGKGKPVVHSSRDSKFSSISSLPSLKTLNLSSPTTTPSPSVPSSATTVSTALNAHISLSRSEFTRLQSLLRRAHRRLKQQEFLASNLANNLLFIFARKELQIQNLRRFRKSEQANMMSTIFRTKEHCGRLFLRKAAFLQHSFASLDKLRKAVQEAEKEAVDAIPEACTSRWAGEGIRFVVEREVLGDWVAEMERDLGLQRGLDGDLRKGVKERAGEKRWVGNVSEGTMMIRFVGFLEGRLGALEGCYGRIGEVLKGIEEIAREGEGTSCL
ncbi:hypothetical protein ONS95_005076 [Cadophora gregata]|uniref:uncharacterized protein n=1 Tax=Cadophora gregata TaxID=51156 RepID=UPI0026DABC40|nr:uncharacterized protein ONS95_005076 [Cadophora gregata]KAK0104808.1 hypothetical protein ONS95_005076 [Cadophora gregata]